MRRPHVDWMTRADDAILEFLQNEGNRRLVATPGVIEANIGYTLSTVNQRLKKLKTAGLVEYHDEERGLYEISEHGKAYLSGTVDANELDVEEFS
ncbi:MarR family transcriptional regulator [Halogeometricum luteum]|uniref:MarR family transcriptional regulator n=1 Tax=Halogeometricum luteum TaxID=2950537 RepID=A0ABU2G3K1_9EURY|nr:MarR family transcriptional regulator [Halogeometricum sp. S3BR5-2]MDS0295355.1 MarR family transcriptional regulator [Halogeometricum sp. S3BR5-2]